MWKGKFFLQTGLPGSLPRAPTVLYDPDYPPLSRKDKRKRQEAKAGRVVMRLPAASTNTSPSPGIAGTVRRVAAAPEAR